MPNYPNSRVAPHQERADNRNGVNRLITREELGQQFSPNRAQRRDYVTRQQTRNNRLHLIGFGRWRKHNARTEESNAKITSIAIADLPLAPRAERRFEMIEKAKERRRLRRQMEGT